MSTVADQTLISVVIPAYNAESFLSEAIESVLNQTFADWNLIVIDDGSTDDTAAVVEQYAVRDHRIHLVQKENQGVSATRNLGVQLSKVRYIAFLDADDRWLPTKLETHLKHFQATSGLGVSYARASFISGDGKALGIIPRLPLKHLKPENFLYENPAITTSNLVARREVFDQVGGFDAEMSYSEDIDWLFRVMCDGRWQVEGIDEVLIEYRLTGQGLSSSLYRIESGWQTLMRKARIVNPELVSKHYSIAQASHLRYLARQSLRLNLPSQVSVDFITRAWQSDWKIVFRNPYRIILTTLAIYGQYILRFALSPFVERPPASSL